MAKGSGGTGHGAPTKAPDHQQQVLSAAGSVPTKTGAIRLADLRSRLQGMSRGDQDAAIHALHKSGRVAIYRDDNTPKVTSRDHEAAIEVGGQPRHIMYLK